MKKLYQGFIPPIISLLLTSTIILFFTTLSLPWKISIILFFLLMTCCVFWMSGSRGEMTAIENESAARKKKIPLQELSILLEYNDAIISILNSQMHTLFRSPAAARITGWPDAEFGLRSVAEHCHPDDCALFSEVFRRALTKGDSPQHISFRLQHKQGHYIWLDGWITNMLENPAVQGVVTNLRDVTALKRMAAETEKTRRFYQFLSEVNHMIVQASTEEQLFAEACQIAVTTGGYRYAFVAMMNDDHSALALCSHADAAGSAGASTGGDLLQIHQHAAAGIMSGHSYSIQRVNEYGRPAHNSSADSAIFSDHNSSLILLPVCVKNLPAGVACIWSAPGYSFDESEISLLKEMATDISYSLSHLREEQLRLKTQHELRESQRRYEVLTESAPVGIFHTDETGYTTYVNPRWREISGMKKAPALGDDWLAAVHPDDREKLRQGWENATDVHQSSSTSEYRFLKPDGDVVHVLGLAVAQTDSLGKVTGYVGTIIDITERKKAEQEILHLLKEVTHEKNLSDSIINSLPGIFYLYDKNGRFLRWNADFSKVSGYPDEMIKQIHPLDLFTGEDKEVVRQKIEQTFSKGEETVQAEFVTIAGTGIPYYFTGKRIQYKGETCLLGVGIDFTERIAAQQKIRETTDQLRLLAAHLQDIREEERKSIGREIHDELGQTLTAIKMDIAWINKQIADNEVLKEKLKNVNILLDRSNRSVRKILTQLRPGIFRSGGMLDAIGWLVEQFKETSSIEADFQCNKDHAELPDGISTCIFRVIQEALTNITRYSQASLVNCRLQIEEQFVQLVIRDNGVGFDIAAIPSHKSFGILGMKERVLSSGGVFELKSEKGSGTEIRIRIPLETKE
jgi:PAS domain S-box-containing protein